MSTAIPLTLIEGAMALPRLRPLACLPAQFGNQWVLQPPNISLRAELKALYAAILRTFCLNAAAIRSMCRWEQPHAAAAAAFDSTEQAEAAHAEATVAYAVGVTHPQHGASPRWAALAGGACALSGAAVLAWIALGHMAQHRASPLEGQRDPLAGQIAPLPGPHETPLRPPAPPAPPAPNRSEPARLASPDVAAASGPTHKEAAGPHAANNGNPHLEVSRHAPRASNASVKTLKRPVKMVSRGASSRHPTAKVATRRWAKPSAAGHFSPSMHNALGVDNYASIRMSAGTHVRKPARPDLYARAIETAQANSIHRDADTPRTHSAGSTDSTAWAQQISQRRVTEIPDQFAK